MLLIAAWLSIRNDSHSSSESVDVAQKTDWFQDLVKVGVEVSQKWSVMQMTTLASTYVLYQLLVMWL